MKTHFKFNSDIQMWIASRLVLVDAGAWQTVKGIGETPKAAFENFNLELEMATSDIHQ